MGQIESELRDTAPHGVFKQVNGDSPEDFDDLHEGYERGKKKQQQSSSCFKFKIFWVFWISTESTEGHISGSQSVVQSLAGPRKISEEVVMWSSLPVMNKIGMNFFLEFFKHFLIFFLY